MSTETKDKAAPTATDPNASKTNAENPVETHEAQEAVSGDTEAKVETETIDKDYLFVHNLDPARQIPGTNKYLDIEQRKSAEIDRAAVEGRDPDFDNLPAAQGTPYRSAEQLKAELPPHASLKADVTLPVVVTKDDADRAKDAEEKAKALQNVTVFVDPAKAQDRTDEGNTGKTAEQTTSDAEKAAKKSTGADGAKQSQDTEGNKNAESGK